MTSWTARAVNDSRFTLCPPSHHSGNSAFFEDTCPLPLPCVRKWARVTMCIGPKSRKASLCTPTIGNILTGLIICSITPCFRPRQLANIRFTKIHTFLELKIGVGECRIARSFRQIFGRFKSTDRIIEFLNLDSFRSSVKKKIGRIILKRLNDHWIDINTSVHIFRYESTTIDRRYDFQRLYQHSAELRFVRTILSS